MDSENPTQVQWAPENERPPRTPLVLIHDGGGTTFGYHCLGPLNRDVYAIHNPNYYTGKEWAGGMDEMARHYIDLMKQAGITGKVLLGGWSLGGFLSLNIANMLAQGYGTKNITVKGMLIIDSPFHIPWENLPMETTTAVLPKLPDLVIKSLQNCRGLLTSWRLPEWEGAGSEDGAQETEVSFRAEGKLVTVSSAQIWHQPLHAEASVKPISRPARPLEDNNQDGPPSNANTTTTTTTTRSLAPGSPPPSVLLKCTERAAAKEPSKPSRIDLFRDDTLLGWENYSSPFIRAVVDVGANHYNIFDFAKLDAVTEKINLGLEILDSCR